MENGNVTADENGEDRLEQLDSANPYSNGDKVTHNGKTWMSDIDGNTYAPGVYGWEIT